MEKQRIIVYGLGSEFEEHENFIRGKYNVLGVSAADEKKGLQYRDFINRKDMSQIDFDKVLICSVKYFHDIQTDLICMGVCQEQIMGMHGNVIELSGREPIIVVCLAGGMGNFMFQYALTMRLMAQCPGTKIKVDISWYHMSENVQYFKIPWVFESIFGVELPIAEKEEIAESKRQHRYVERQVSAFQADIEGLAAGYVQGYWQSSKYFQCIQEQVRQAYSFKLRYLSERQKNILNQIGECNNSAAIWVRRGDYLKFSDIYGGICTEEYYQKAMDYLREIYGKVNFFVFSNDPEYVKAKYSEYPCMVYAKESTEICDYSIYLMSLCNHLIIANSTFSWWAAWLKGKKGTVICPKKWVNGQVTPDIWEDSWIKM